MSTSNNDMNFKQQSERALQEQKKIYDKMDFRKVFADRKETIRHFIESEDVAKKYVFQGKFYPMAHYEIAKILKTKMKGFDENEIVKTLYHTIRLGNLYTIDEVNYPHLQTAMALLVPDLEESKYLVCAINRQTVYLLFEVLNEQDIDNIKKTNYSEYRGILDFIAQSNSYSHLPGMRKSYNKFIIFLENKLLLERVKKAVILFSSNKFHQQIGNNFRYLGLIILLLLSEEKASKEALLQLHKQVLSAHLVWLLGTFYKDFQNTQANKELLIDLYEKFPHDWIDKFQQKTYDWETN